jgi:serine/threonine protein kinase
MSDVEELMSRLIEISEVKMPGGWRGWVAVRDAGRERFSKEEWEQLLAEPEKLLEGSQQTLKSEGVNRVVIKYLSAGGRGVKAVIKRHEGRGVKGLFRLLKAPRAMRNFIAAVRIRQAGLPVAGPLAAVYRKSFGSGGQNIYISEYIDGFNLYEFLKDLPSDSRERLKIIGQLSEQLAEIFAGLHKKGLWHRDAKATNFVVYEGDEGYQVAITDVDGIKQYLFCKKSRQMQWLWQLAASVMELGVVNRTDFLRMLRAYCEKAGVPESQEREIFGELIKKAEAKYRRNQRKRTVEDGR